MSEGTVRRRIRDRRDDDSGVRPIELFFDLVYVLAFIQITHHLLEHLSVRAIGETLVLLAIVWLGWIHMVWITNYFSLETVPIRVMLLGAMLAGLVMSASIPHAFDSRGLVFALAVAAMLIGAPLFLLLTVGRSHDFAPLLRRALAWWTVVAAILVIGAGVEGGGRAVIWLAAYLLASVVMWTGFPVPFLGRLFTRDFTIVGGHIAHRCLLFITIALGESILTIGSNFGELSGSVERTMAFLVAFGGSVALWWIYFDRGPDVMMPVLRATEDPGRTALSAYTFFHIPMVAGIIALAAVDELVIADPGEETTAVVAVLTLGGAAFYLAGSALYRRAVTGKLPKPRGFGLAALGALIPVAVVASALTLLTMVTVVLVVVAGCESWTARSRSARTT